LGRHCCCATIVFLTCGFSEVWIEEEGGGEEEGVVVVVVVVGKWSEVREVTVGSKE
jgi:hypothetical protein